MLKRILQKLSDNEAIMFPPEPAFELRELNEKLVNKHFAKIPDDYAKVLKVTDGLIWDGFELYGVKNKNRTDYVYPSIEDVNWDVNYAKVLENKVIVGKTAEAFMLFDADTSRYHVVNRIDFMTIDTFSNLADAMFLFTEELFK